MYIYIYIVYKILPRDNFLGLICLRFAILCSDNHSPLNLDSGHSNLSLTFLLEPFK